MISVVEIYFKVFGNSPEKKVIDCDGIDGLITYITSRNDEYNMLQTTKQIKYREFSTNIQISNDDIQLVIFNATADERITLKKFIDNHFTNVVTYVYKKNQQNIYY